MSRSISALLSVVLAAAVTTACGSDTPTSPTPSTPTVVNDTFTGTLTVNGGITHRFTAQSGGTAVATLASVGPDTGEVVGFAMGTWSGSTCQLLLTNDSAVQTSAITGTIGTAGELCVRVYDVGQLSAPVSYVLTVQHP